MSSDRTDGVIEAIDGALGDWSVSPDAMRWAPTPAPSIDVDRSDPDMITMTIEPDTSRFEAAIEELRVSFVVFIDQVTRAALVLDGLGIRTVKDVDRRIRRWQIEQRQIRQAMRHIERRAARRRRRAAPTAQ